MRFIDVTRYGGVKTLRLSVAAIAYVDACEGGSAIRLIGGETLRVNEDCATVEARAIDEGFLLVAGDIHGEPLPPIEPREVPKPRRSPARKGKRK